MKMDRSAALAAMSGAVPSYGGARSFAGSEAAQSAALGNYVKTGDQTKRKERRQTNFAMKSAAANILKKHNEKDAVRVSHCRYVARQDQVQLMQEKASGKAHFTGLKTCGSVWWCPCCSPRIAAKRKLELDTLFSGARAEGLAVVMLTLTARHDRKTDLVPFLDGMKAAKKRLRERREWRALPIVGSVTATEVTHGASGWHPHHHEIILLKASESEALEMVEGLRAVWLRCLEAYGMSGNKHAFQVQGASAAGAYVAKFGAAEEIALHGKKQGRDGSRTPWQLLEDAEEKDEFGRLVDPQAAILWGQYAMAFKGRRQLVWSRGLKKRFGIDEVSDEAAASDEAVNDMQVLRVWLGKADWRQARRRMVSLLFAAETGGCLDAAEFGPTDSHLWRLRSFGSVIDEA